MQFPPHILRHLQQKAPQYLPRHLRPQPANKVYIVSNGHGCMVGIESLFIMHVSPSAQEAFLKQYEGRIILEGNSAEEVRAKFNEIING